MTDPIEVFEYGCFNCCKPITVGQLAEHRCEQPEQSPRTTADNPATSSDTADGAHNYLSTGCLHGRHDYCSNVDGIAGSKAPAQCKFCAAPCRCSCHAMAS